MRTEATQAWLDKQTKSSSALAVAMGNAELQLGSPLTLENYGITKGQHWRQPVSYTHLRAHETEADL
eukprot:817575-Amphidinium_carterae.1